MHIDQNWRFSLRQNELDHSFDLHIWRRVGGRTEVMNLKDVSITSYDQGAAGVGIVKTPLLLSSEDARALAAELNGLGFRTDRNAVIEGELKATKSHLEDMRTLVFEKPQEETRVARHD